jgi:FkbM family methyltransferase
MPISFAFIEKIKLSHRANKYQTKDDKGGIQYILESVQPGQVVFDIGAHKGGYLYFFQQLVGSKGKVFAFEPQSFLFNYLQKIHRLFKWQNVQLHHLALSDSAGSVTLFIPVKENKKSSSPGATIVAGTHNDAVTENVETQTLDSFAQQNNTRVDFIKLDVEGNELRVLQGAIHSINTYHPKIIFECERRHVGEAQVKETIAFVENLGYTGRFIYDTQFLPLSEFDFEKHQDINKQPYCNNFIFEYNG